jgi:hypothetical protein
MLDTVARVGAGVAQRRQGEHQLGAGDAVHGDGAVLLVAAAHPIDERVERGQRRFVQMDLGLPGGDPVAVASAQLEGAGNAQPLQQAAFPAQFAEYRHGRSRRCSASCR